METMTLWADALLVAALAAWIGVGVRENIRAPGLNTAMVADVLAMQTMQKDFPAQFELVKRDRIDDKRFHRVVFAAIVLAEMLVTVLLGFGALDLAGAALGLFDPAPARVFALAGTLAFTLIWVGFLVGGQWFHYWLAHTSAQQTHFFLAIWGVATALALMQA